jgi:hypothetical protein
MKIEHFLEPAEIVLGKIVLDVDLIRLQEAEMMLEIIGVRHAPAQVYTDDPTADRRSWWPNGQEGGIDGRFLISEDAPGAYYISGADNLRRRIEAGKGAADEIQLLFKDVPDNSLEIAAKLEWEIVERKPLPADCGSVISCLLRPRL